MTKTTIPPQRHCLAFGADGLQCRQVATYVCTDADGFQWYACRMHGHVGVQHLEHTAVRCTPIDEWWSEVMKKGN